MVPLDAFIETIIQGDQLCLVISGNWTVGTTLPDPLEIKMKITASKISSLVFDTTGLDSWDSAFLLFISRIMAIASNTLKINNSGLPQGCRSLLKLSSAIPHYKPANRQGKKPSYHILVGIQTVKSLKAAGEFLEFTGQVFLSFVRFFTGRARYLKSDVLIFLQECGPSALPIVSLISILVGIILAFVGAVQLQMFGAEIYIANLVALGMTREMGPMMAAVIMAGRSGAAFAAQIGSMQVNEEVDALKTMGINPYDFLVIPRMIAMIVMMPLLAIWADLLGILGGFIIAILQLDISITEYYYQTLHTLNHRHVGVGIFKAAIFGYLVAFAGCLRGMHCARSAAAVGKATTSAVVIAIVFIVISDAFFTFVFNMIHI